MKNIFSLFSNWNPIPDSNDNLRKAQIIAAQEFGDQHHLSGTTQQMAQHAIVLSRRYNIPIVCQFPGDRELLVAGITPLGVITANQLDPNEYLDTHEVNRQVANICKDQGITRVIVVTHPHHAFRVAEDLKTFGLIPLIPDLRGIKYDPLCSRLSLRTPWIFIPREIGARILFFFKGYMRIGL